MPVGLIVPAAGSGSRFGGAVPKQLRELHGVPVLVHSLRAFAGLVDDIVVPVSADIAYRVAELLTALDLGCPVRTVAGGSTRMRSVAAGLHALDPACDRVLVHDAARPLIRPAIIAACIAALDEHPAAVVAVPCSSTVKRVHQQIVAETVPREDLWLAQTPQGFQRAAGEAAFAAALAGDNECSDDVQVLEQAGHAVAIVPGDADNLKLTTAGDLAIAAALLGAIEPGGSETE